jgi:phosphoribosyl-ATP pyrophosphohydrolase
VINATEKEIMWEIPVTRLFYYYGVVCEKYGMKLREVGERANLAQRMKMIRKAING